MTAPENFMGSERPPFVFWVCLWLVPLAPGVVFMASDIAHLRGLLIDGVGQWIGRDFSDLWLAGRLAVRGGDPYDLATYFRWIHDAGIIAAEYYPYPPHSLIILGPLSLLPYPVALTIWTVTGAILLYLAARPVVEFDARWVLVSTPLLFFNGQFGAITAALWLWSFRAKQVQSGFAAGLLTVKPHLGILLAVSMLTKRRFVQIAVAVTVAVSLLLIAELRFGLLRDYLTEATATQRSLLTASADQPYFAGMGSAYVALRHTSVALPVQLLVSGIALGLLWRIRHRPFEVLCFPFATATFILLPYSFGYDMMVVPIGFANILYSRWGELTLAEKLVATLACISPALTFAGVVAPLLLAGLWVQVRLIAEDHGSVSTA